MSDAIDKLRLKWYKLCGVRASGWCSSIERQAQRNGLVFAKVQESGDEAVKMHCIIHQEALFHVNLYVC